MKTLINKLTFTLVLALAAGLAFGQVKSDYDKDFDFTKIKTYSFSGWQKDSDKQLNDFDKKRILESLQSEFDARGLKLVDSDADANVALYLVLDAKKSTTAYTDYMGGMGFGAGWGWDMGAGMGMGSSTTTYSENDYTEGTFVIDLYEGEGKKLIWQGVLTKVVQEKPEKRDKTIPKSISKVMNEFPIAPTK